MPLSAARPAKRSDSSGARTVTAALASSSSVDAPFGHDPAADDKDGALLKIREQG